MLFIISVLSLYVFLKTIGYAIYEYKDNSNKPVAFIVAVLGIISLIGPILIEINRWKQKQVA